MKILNGKITEATDAELFEYWIRRFDAVMPYEVYKAACVRHGTKIVEEVRT